MRGRQVRVVARRGDSLYGIARKTGIDVQTLARPERHGVAHQAARRPETHPGRRSAGRRPTGSRKGARAAAGRARAQGHLRGAPRRHALQHRATPQVSVANLTSWNKISGESIQPGQKLIAFIRHGG